MSTIIRQKINLNGEFPLKQKKDDSLQVQHKFTRLGLNVEKANDLMVCVCWFRIKCHAGYVYALRYSFVWIGQ